MTLNTPKAVPCTHRRELTRRSAEKNTLIAPIEALAVMLLPSHYFSLRSLRSWPTTILLRQTSLTWHLLAEDRYSCSCLKLPYWVQCSWDAYARLSSPGISVTWALDSWPG